MSTLYLHSVWKETLTKDEREKLTTFFHTLPEVQETLEVTPYLIKHKKNGGIVATAFIQNSFNEPLYLDEVIVQILNENQKAVADYTFTPKLSIPAKSAMPWSFVFPKGTILKKGEVEPGWSLSIEW